MTIQHKTIDEADEADDLAAIKVDYRIRSALCETPIANLDMHTRLITAEPQDNLRQALEKIKQVHGGAVVVVEPGTQRLVGIMTERDLLNKFIGRGLNPSNEYIRDYMTPNPEYLTKNDKIAYALHKMSVLGFRNIPVADIDRNVIGLITVNHIIDYIAECLSDEIYNLRPDPLRGGFVAEEGA